MSKNNNKGKSRKPSKGSGIKATVPIEQRILEYVQVEERPDLADAYRSVMTLDRPVAEALVSNTPLLKEAAKVTLRNLRNLGGDQDDLNFQIMRVATRPITAPHVSVVEARSLAGKFKKNGNDGLGAVRFCPVYDSGRAEWMIATDFLVLYSGYAPRTLPIRRRSRTSIWERVKQSPVETIARTDKAGLKRVLTAMFHPPLTKVPKHDPLHEVDDTASASGSVMERALVTVMCRSQEPVRKMLIGFGAGDAIVKAVNAHVDYLVKEACKGKDEVLHRDLISHFWFEELRRLGLDHLTVPQIKLR